MSGNIKYDKWINDDNSENYKCRAWVNFDGEGTVAIRASGNVSSVTDNGTGKFTVNFISDMVDVNYAINALSSATAGTTYVRDVVAFDDYVSTSSVQLGFQHNQNYSWSDPVLASVTIFR